MSRELERLSALHSWLADVLAEARGAKTPEAREAALRRAKWLLPKEHSCPDYSSAASEYEQQPYRRQTWGRKIPEKCSRSERRLPMSEHEQHNH